MKYIIYLFGMSELTAHKFSPHEKKFSTDNVRSVRDKYQVWYVWSLTLSFSASAQSVQLGNSGKKAFEISTLQYLMIDLNR